MVKTPITQDINTRRGQIEPSTRKIIVDVLLDLMTVDIADAYDAAELISVSVFGCMPTSLPDFSSEQLDGTLSNSKTFAARVLGKRGGRKGGLQRAKNLSPDKRKEIARNAALVRWYSDKETKYKKTK